MSTVSQQQPQQPPPPGYYPSSDPAQSAYHPSYSQFLVGPPLIQAPNARIRMQAPGQNIPGAPLMALHPSAHPQMAQVQQVQQVQQFPQHLPGQYVEMQQPPPQYQYQPPQPQTQSSSPQQQQQQQQQQPQAQAEPQAQQQQQQQPQQQHLAQLQPGQPAQTAQTASGQPGQPGQPGQGQPGQGQGQGQTDRSDSRSAPQQADNRPDVKTENGQAPNQAPNQPQQQISPTIQLNGVQPPVVQPGGMSVLPQIQDTKQSPPLQMSSQHLHIPQPQMQVGDQTVPAQQMQLTPPRGHSPESYNEYLLQRQQQQQPQQPQQQQQQQPQASQGLNAINALGMNAAMLPRSYTMPPQMIPNPASPHMAQPGSGGFSTMYGCSFPPQMGHPMAPVGMPSYPKPDGSVSDPAVAAAMIRAQQQVYAQHAAVAQAAAAAMGLSHDVRIAARPHGQLRKHECSVCGKAFARPSALRTHVYTHTGEKPFTCSQPGCNRSFSVLSNLRRHQRVHIQEH